MKFNWKFLGGVQNKKHSVGGGGVWIFSGTAQCKLPMLSQATEISNQT